MKFRFTLSSTAGGTLVLSDEPIGWAESTLEFARDKDWHGIFFAYTLSLKFYETGYDYLKNVYETAGIDEYVELLVEVACSERDSFEEFYVGKIIMGTLSFDCRDDCTVEARIDPAGCLMQFRNRIDQAVDLDTNEDFDGDALTSYTALGEDIQLLPKAIVKRTHGQNSPSSSLTYNDPSGRVVASGTGSQSMTDVAYFQIPYDSYDLTEVNTVNSLALSYASSPGLMNDLFVCGEAGTYGFTFDVDAFIKSAADFHDPFSSNSPDCWTGSGQPEYFIFEDWTIKLVAYKNGSTLVYSNTLLTITGDCVSHGSSAPWGKQNVCVVTGGNFSAAMVPGDTVQIGFEITVGGSWQRSLLFNNPIEFNHELQFSIPTTITIRGVLQSDPTPCRVYLINEVLSRVVEGITDDCMRVYSDYFGRTDAQPYTSGSDGCGSLEVLMKGKHIRQFPDADVLMTVSFKDLFDALNSIHCIGIGIEPDTHRGGGHDLIRVEPFTYWYDDSTILITCDNVPALTRKVNADGYLSLFSFGYEKWEGEQSMGLDEFCVKREYRTTLKEVKSTLEKRCKFMASGYAIETTRRLAYTADSTKDWRFDNETFILCVRRDGGGNIVVEQGADCADTSTMTDIIDPPTVYNFRISPLRNLMRWAHVLFASYYPNIAAPGAQFVFNTGEGNYKAKGTLINGCYQEAAEIAENDTVDINSFANTNDANPVLRNETVQFDYPVDWTTIRAWRQNPSLLRGKVKYREFSFQPWSYGFITKIQYKPNDGIASFTLQPTFS